MTLRPTRDICVIFAVFVTTGLQQRVVAQQDAALEASSTLADESLRQPETPDDAYVPGPREEDSAARGGPQTFTRGGFVSVQVNVALSGHNLFGDAANEPSIAVNPVVPGQITIGWRQFDSVLSNFRQAGWAYSHDSGATWTFPGRIEAGTFRSDPVLNVSPEGVFYYYSLKNDFTCDMFRSFDGGVSWGPRIPAFGGDKAWMAVDHTNGVGRGNIYMSWSSNAACCGTNIFSRSVDGGLNYSVPVPVAQNPRFGQVAVGPDGAVYIVDRAFGTVAVLKSTDANDPPFPATFVSQIANIGGSTAFGGVNPAGLLGQMNISVDHSDGPTHGYVYILGSVDPPGSDPLDVMFARSTDGGTNWDPPVRVNDDSLVSDSYQWFGTMSVSTNGRIDVIFNDTRASADDSRSELFYTSSTDGGQTWAINIPVSPSFDHSVGYPNQNKLGDYYDMVSDDFGADVAYAATFNNEQDVYYLRIGPPDCNSNGVDDRDDVTSGTSDDCNNNNVPDECEEDCNATGVPDDCDIANETSEDCNFNNRPDECDLVGNDCNADGSPDDCQAVELLDSLMGPANLSVCPQADAQITVASTFGGLTYQWLFDGVPLVDGVDVVGSETATLTVLSADLTNLGIYSCIVSDGCISTESGSASLSLFAPGAIVQQPTPLATTCTGNIVLLSVGASGDGLIYQWLQDGLSLQEQPGKYENVDTATLRIVNANVADLAEYTCVVNDNCGGEETSTSAFLQFGDISYVVQPSPACAVQGDNVSYTASAEAGGFSIFVQWYKDGIPLSEGGDFSGVFTDTLVVQNASVGDEGAYSQRALSLGPNCVLFSDEVSLQLNSCFCVLPGDMDSDGDLDLVDIQRFAECFEANVASITNCACANVDDTDDSVNLADWDAYAPILTGP